MVRYLVMTSTAFLLLLLIIPSAPLIFGSLPSFPILPACLCVWFSPFSSHSMLKHAWMILSLSLSISGFLSLSYCIFLFVYLFYLQKYPFFLLTCICNILFKSFHLHLSGICVLYSFLISLDIFLYCNEYVFDNSVAHMNSFPAFVFL